MVKIAIVGSRIYENRRKVKDFIFNIKQKFGDKLEIVSGGQPKGADGFVKKYALEMDIKYSEFPPVHYAYNMWCILGPENYGQTYRVWNFNARNTQVVEYSDYIFAFIPDGHESRGTLDTIKKAKKLNKKVVIFN